MSRKSILTNLRTTRGDEHGVTDLLREVSQRSCSLTDEERREVSEIVRRVEEHHARGTPMGKLKKKISDNINSINDSINDNINSINDSFNGNINSINNVAKFSGTNDDSDSKRGTGANSLNSIGSTSMNNWGKDLLQKMSSIEIEKPWTSQKDPTTAKPDAKEVFRNFSIKGIQNPLKLPQQGTSNGEKDRRPEIMKAFERSSQSGRDLLQNFSKNFQNSLTVSPPQAPRESAKAVSDSLFACHGIKRSRAANVPSGKNVYSNNQSE